MSNNNSSGNPHFTRKIRLHSKSTYFYRWCSYVVPGACVLALLFGGFIAINPVLNSDSAHAEELNFIVDNNTSISDNSDVALTSDPVINLTITPNINDSTNSNVTAGAVAYFSNTVTVGGTGISKYYLTLSSPAGSNGNLVGQANPGITVGKVNGGTLPANFSDNTWGYAISSNTSIANSDLTYHPVPAGNNSTYLAIKTGTPDAEGDNYKLVFAAKIGDGMPADHYGTNAYISAVANAEMTVANWFVETANILICSK